MRCIARNAKKQKRSNATNKSKTENKNKMKKTIDWFMSRIGQTVIATNSSNRFFTGRMVITSEDHANYLCFVSQETQRYTFADIEPQAKPEVGPVETSSAMLFELKKFADLLLQIKERPGFQTLFNEGEQCSINELLKRTQGRIKIADSLQQSFL